MTLILEQSFPLGRFHATRWNQNPFEDRHGEWPPSPWRLLRAIAARWFQYARETGDEDEAARNELFEQLAAQPPVFHLPAFTWRGDPAPRQYHKTEVGWTDASAKAGAYKKPKTTLAVDPFRVISPADQIVWVWDKVELAPRIVNLLDALLRRILYFGRAETHCRFAIGTKFPQDLLRCELLTTNKTDSPVLVATPGRPLNLTSLLATTDDRVIKGRRIPPDTEWRYARLSKCPTVTKQARRKPKLPSVHNVIQFVVGGRVFPGQSDWVRVIEKFRGSVLKHAARIVSGGEYASYRDLPPELREKLKLLSGKDGSGNPVQGHQHAYYFLLPDEFGNPARLMVYRSARFDAIEDQTFEVEAILAASREPIFWQGRDPDWSLRIVPLPFETPAPAGCRIGDAVSERWVSATPFVPPNRHRFRENGRLRLAETATALLKRELAERLSAVRSQASIVGIQSIDGDGNCTGTRPDQDPEWSKWVTIHETLSERARRMTDRSRRVRPGFCFRVEFSEPVPGPLLVGHSCHFGLGLFVPENVNTPRSPAVAP